MSYLTHFPNASPAMRLRMTRHKRVAVLLSSVSPPPDPLELMRVVEAAVKNGLRQNGARGMSPAKFTPDEWCRLILPRTITLNLATALGAFLKLKPVTILIAHARDVTDAPSKELP